MAEIHDMASALGQALGRTSEYQALERAIKRADDDRDLVTLRNEIQNLEGSFKNAMAQGNQPDQEDVEAYEQSLLRLQSLASYQAMVAAQANFEKIMHRVNEAIHAGMAQGASSRIIIPS